MVSWDDSVGGVDRPGVGGENSPANTYPIMFYYTYQTLKYNVFIVDHKYCKVVSTQLEKNGQVILGQIDDC